MIKLKTYEVLENGNVIDKVTAINDTIALKKIDNTYGKDHGLTVNKIPEISIAKVLKNNIVLF